MEHIMQMTQSASEGGYEWWKCPECGRTYMLKWEPWERIIVEPGDEQAAHSGSKGPLLFKMDISQ